MPRLSSLTSKALTILSRLGALPSPTYSVVPSTTSLNEGSSVTFNITTTNVVNGTTLYWTNGGTTTAGDFVQAINSGSVTINNGAASVVLTLTQDVTTEGNETIIFQLRTVSTSGTIVATASTVTANDTSVAPTYSVTPATSNVNEGASLTFNISTTNVVNSTVLYWSISHITTVAADFSVNSGQVAIVNNAANFSITPTADSTTEGAQTFQVQITTSVGGSVVATSSTVTVNDTSLTPSIQVQYMVLGGGGGGGSRGGNGGGGGAGSMRTNINAPFNVGTINPAAVIFPYAPGTSYNIAIGGGGAGSRRNAPTVYAAGAQGGNTTLVGPFGTLTGIGGGRGGGVTPTGTGEGGAGGCGGGHTFNTNTAGGSQINPADIVSRGFSGGNQSNAQGAARFGTGGGGLNAAGSASQIGPVGVSGAGGPGISWQGIYVCGGGGSGGAGTLPSTAFASGGSYGGGGGGIKGGPLGSNPPGGAGTPATGSGGGGGGGAYNPGQQSGGNGGSGVVIIGYPGPQIATGGTISSASGFTIHTFTGNGTFRWN